jgi:methyl-accepting chemotaxis protein
MAISMRGIYGLFGGTLLVLGGATLLSTVMASHDSKAALEASARRYESYLLADELRQSSDNLTRLARTYVVTGDAKWEKQYLEILDIRNGKVPRPKNYDRVFWDFRAVDDGYQQGTEPAASLSDRMKQAGFTEQEFGKLTEAANNSNELVRTETIAMNMVKGLVDDGKGGFTKGEPDLAKAREMMHDLSYHQFKAKIMKPVNEFLVLLDERTLKEVEDARARSGLWNSVSVVAVVALVLALGFMLWWTRRETFGIIGRISGLSKTIATGDLSRDATIEGCAEGREILGELNRMQGQLRETITEVRRRADSIATGSSEIATGSVDLSQRTEEQAANLEQTAASMEQLTATVQQNTETARQANQLAASASKAAAEGGSIVGEVVTTMGAISDSSRRINDIIGVIDSIAFQTNILALNAAVEAARAGEQGRGFAVVAGEVRTLAQRSAQAAKEIKQLIGESVEKVEAGSQLVHNAGQSMAEIVAKVRQVTDLIGEIASASEEQNSGIGQVGSAVSQLDQVTQQNAALVEESAAAADSLKEQASRLTELMDTFKLHGA